MALVPWPRNSGVPKKSLEGFGGFEARQTAGLNARKKLLMSALKAKKKLFMWPWCVGLRGQGCQKSVWTVLERLKPGKRQA